MSASGMLARPLLAGVFVVGGFDALRDPESKAKAAGDVAPQIAAALGLPTTDTVTLVRINGGIQVVAGTLLALGKGRRLAALVLAASLIPTTYAGHRFWDELDEEQRAQQRIHFLKNLAMLGGLVLAAGDTGGRATLGWQARRATRHAMDAAAAAGLVTEQAAQHLLASSGHARNTMQGGTSQFVHQAQQARDAVQGGTAQLIHQAHQAGVAMQGGSTQLVRQAHDVALAAWPPDLDLAGMKRSALKAAKKASLKATKSQYSRRALNAARKAGRQAQHVGRDAGRHARDVARNVDASEAVDWVRDAAATVGQELGARAHDAMSLVS